MINPCKSFYIVINRHKSVFVGHVRFGIKREGPSPIGNGPSRIDSDGLNFFGAPTPPVRTDRLSALLSGLSAGG